MSKRHSVNTLWHGSRADPGHCDICNHCGEGSCPANRRAALFSTSTAERQVIDFLRADQRHRFVISTHSAVFMNSVEADRITHIEAPGKAYSSADQEVSVSRILLDLGYRNSDVLFYDALIVVEGRTDKAILPSLLALAGVRPERLARVGFPTLEGAPERLRNLQTAILKYEKLIGALSQTNIPRIYLLDGDRSPDDRNTLQSMQTPRGARPYQRCFFPGQRLRTICSFLRQSKRQSAKKPNWRG